MLASGLRGSRQLRVGFEQKGVIQPIGGVRPNSTAPSGSQSIYCVFAVVVTGSEQHRYRLLLVCNLFRAFLDIFRHFCACLVAFIDVFLQGFVDYGGDAGLLLL